MANEKKSINRIIILNVLSTFLVQAIGFFSAPLFSRLMGTKNYGIYVTYHTWVSIVAVIFGLQTNASIGIAIQEYDKDEQIQYQSSIYFLSMLTCVVLSAIALLFKKPLVDLMQIDTILLPLILVQGLCTITISFMNSKFTMEYKAGRNMLVSISSSLGGVLLSAVLFYIVPNEENYLARIVGCVVVDLVITILFCLILFYKGRSFYNKGYWRFCIPIAVPMIFHALSGIILNQSDRVIMQRMLNYSSVGIYSLSFSFCTVVSSIYMALNNSFAPFYYDYLNSRDTSSIRRRSKDYIELFTIIVIGFMLLSPEVFGVFASSDFMEGKKYIPLFCIGFFFIFLYSFSVNYEMFMRKSGLVALATGISAAINIVMNILFIKMMGIMGVVLATAISDFIQYVIHYIFSIRISKWEEPPVPIRLQFPFIVIAVMVCGICLIIGGRFTLTRWILGFLLGGYELSKVIRRKAIF